MQSTTRALWPWVKVVLALVALDWALFGLGLFFRLVPEAPRHPVTWGLVHRVVRRLATPSDASPVYAIGSSIVYLGVDEAQVQVELDRRDVPSPFTALTVFGSSGVDQALIAHAAEHTHPWLVILTGSVRDFPVDGQPDSPTRRVLLDASVDLPALRPRDVENRLASIVGRYWQLYRNRALVRLAVDEWAGAIARDVAPAWAPPPPPPPGPSPASSDSGVSVPPEALEWFMPNHISRRGWAAWTHWRETRRFLDYVQFMNLNGGAGMASYADDTFATHGPEGNVSVDALAWAEDELRAAGVRVVVIAFPENPILQAPEARAVIDPRLADAIAARLASDAHAHGARFVDLRAFLEPDDFYDLIHPNRSGARKLSVRLADLIAEEWHARTADR